MAKNNLTWSFQKWTKKYNETLALHVQLWIAVYVALILRAHGIMLVYVDESCWSFTWEFSCRNEEKLISYLLGITLHPRKLISYCTGRYRRNFLYWCLGQYRNALVSFRFKYWLYRSRFGHTGINIGFRPENRYRAKQKNSENPPNFKIHLLTLTSVFPPLLHICLCYAFLLLFLCFAGLCFYSPFIFFIYFSMCVYLSF